MSPLQEWLRQVAAGNSEAELQISAEEDQLSGLSLKDVLQAHRDWKTRLESDLESEQIRTLSVFDVCRDDLCTLGKWLNGPGRSQFGQLPAYEAVRKAHADFHQCAGELLRGRRNRLGEEQLTSISYRLKDASSRNQLELVRLFINART